MNHVSFYGKVGADPTSVSFADSENKVVKFSLAVKDVYSKQEKPEPIWIDVDAWNGLGERVLKLVKKGREVIVNGRLSISIYEKEINGVKVKMKKPVVKLTDFTVCGSKPKETEATEEAVTPKKRKTMA
ncbi:MAG: single-stranded DNA-binding protein [Cyanobacteria bacterium SZAS TMP-1]|nr:single-stranded DNA-binding protein [Cyanobacteria bacterium SZAS TMP-1]